MYTTRARPSSQAAGNLVPWPFPGVAGVEGGVSGGVTMVVGMGSMFQLVVDRVESGGGAGAASVEVGGGRGKRGMTGPD